MAEFSKQYCERHMEDMPGDFDIMDVFNALEPDHYVEQICEGYGFLAIGHAGDDGCVLAMPVEHEPHGTVVWKKIEEVVK